MSFLLAKIVILLLAAALLGAWFARWWLRRHFEDVTGEYSRLQADWNTWRRGLDEKLAQKPIDLGPVQDRLDRLESALRGLNNPKPVTTDFAPVLSAIAAIPKPIPPTPPVPPTAVDLGPLQQRVDALERAVRAIVIPPSTTVDLQPLLQQIESLQARWSAPPAADPAALPSPSQIVRSGSRNLLAHAAFGRPDDLQRIKGVKDVMERMLHDVGVYYFWQIADWTPEDIQHADARLPAFHGRIERDHWVQQASEFLTSPTAAPKPVGF